jgi:stage V sporulation protein B
MSPDIRSWVLKPGIVGVVMLLIGKYIYSFFEIFISSRLLLTTAAVLGNIIIAVILMVAIGALDKDEVLRTSGIKRS